MAKEKSPMVIFLIETKCSKEKLEIIKNKLNFDNFFTIDSIGTSGGLSLLWKSNWRIELLNYTRWHISAMVTNNTTNITSWQLISFYGYRHTTHRNSS